MYTNHSFVVHMPEWVVCTYITTTVSLLLLLGVVRPISPVISDFASGLCVCCCYQHVRRPYRNFVILIFISLSIFQCNTHTHAHAAFQRIVIQHICPSLIPLPLWISVSLCECVCVCVHVCAYVTSALFFGAQSVRKIIHEKSTHRLFRTHTHTYTHTAYRYRQLLLAHARAKRGDNNAFVFGRVTWKGISLSWVSTEDRREINVVYFNEHTHTCTHSSVNKSE